LVVNTGCRGAQDFFIGRNTLLIVHVGTGQVVQAIFEHIIWT